MTLPSEFAFLHYGKEIAMLVDCILDLITNLPIRYMVFVSDIQKPSIASHLQGMESSIQFYCQVPAFACI